MATPNRKEIIFPPGRVVAGSLYDASDKDADGKPRIVKTGANAGQATQQYFFAVAYTKTPGVSHWAHEPWGAEIWAIGNACSPGIAQNPAFAWKIVDGDSQIPNKKGVKPCDRPGYKGSWVVSYASTFAPKIVNFDSSAYLLDKGVVMPGDFVQCSAVVDGNQSTQNPGIYINHSGVRYLGQSAEGRIQTGTDALKTNWGTYAVPTGLIAGSSAPPAAPGPAPAPAPLPLAPAPAPAPAPAAPAATLALTPAPAFLAAPPPPPAAPAAPAAPVRKMLGAHTYESLKAANWSDEQMIAAGHMAA